MSPRVFLRQAGGVLVALLYAPCLAAAEQAARPAYTPPPPAVSYTSMAQVIFSLLLVLAVFVLVARLLKRMNLPRQGAGSLLKVVSGVAVGQRERIMLVEVNDTWLVVGVAPGQVRTLHTMPKAELPEIKSGGQTVADNKFQGWLKKVMEKRNAG